MILICRDMAFLVFANFRRLQNANLAGDYISIMIPRIGSGNTMVADLNRSKYESISKIAQAFAACVNALREQFSTLSSLGDRPGIRWDRLVEPDETCKGLLGEVGLYWSDETGYSIKALRSKTNSTTRMEEIFSQLTSFWQSVLSVADLSILTYEGAHTTNFCTNIMGGDYDNIDLDNQPLLHKRLQFRRQKMNCLAEFFDDEDVWIFGYYPGPQPQSYYLCTDIVTFADLWGPVWKVVDTSNDRRIAKYNVRGGSIVPWPYDLAIHPDLESDQQLCHWRSNAASIRFKKVI